MVHQVMLMKIFTAFFLEIKEKLYWRQRTIPQIFEISPMVIKYAGHFYVSLLLLFTLTFILHACI